MPPHVHDRMTLHQKRLINNASDADDLKMVSDNVHPNITQSSMMVMTNIEDEDEVPRFHAVKGVQSSRNVEMMNYTQHYDNRKGGSVIRGHGSIPQVSIYQGHNSNDQLIGANRTQASRFISKSPDVAMAKKNIFHQQNHSLPGSQMGVTMYTSKKGSTKMNTINVQSYGHDVDSNLPRVKK